MKVVSIAIAVACMAVLNIAASAGPQTGGGSAAALTLAAAPTQTSSDSTQVATQQTSTPLTRAKELFEKYVQLGRSFDAGVADLYSDSARIVNRRRYPNGQMRTLRLEGHQYKELIRQSMGLAKATGDRDAFSKVQYRAEGDGVRIRATRFSERKKYSSPFSMLVGPDPDSTGRWLILEETSESRP